MLEVINHWHTCTSWYLFYQQQACPKVIYSDVWIEYIVTRGIIISECNHSYHFSVLDIIA